MANYDINYDDSRFKTVEAEKTVALNEMEKTYAGMIDNSDKYYQQQIDASKQWADKQSQLQQDRTDFAVEQIEQQKDQAHKDYIKEQAGAYVDWRKQSNEYGVESEQMASAGLTNTGFSESSQVSMYNTYQNRVATARDSYNRAVLNYDNAIKDARLQNNAALAEIAYNALQAQLELSLQGFQYKNTLVLAKADKKAELDKEYYNRYQDVLAQINQENALAEEIRQYNEQMAFEREQFAFQKQQYEDAQAKKKKSGGGGGSRSSGTQTTVTKTDNGSTGNSGEMYVVNSPLTPEGAAERVAKGEYNATVVGNQIHLSKNPDYHPGQASLDKYTSLKYSNVINAINNAKKEEEKKGNSTSKNLASYLK
jgi:hypothetical protein